MTITDILLMPGNEVLKWLLPLINIHAISQPVFTIFGLLLSIFLWYWLLRGVKSMLSFLLHRNTSVSDNKGFSIEKSHAWLSIILAAMITVLLAPILYLLLVNLLVAYFEKYLIESLAILVSWMLIVLSLLALHFFLQSWLHGMLSRRFIKKLTQS